MALIFSECKGTIVQAKSGGAGFYKMSPALEVPSPAVNVIRGSSAGSSDIHMPVTTLGGNKIIYSFGPAWSDVTINGTLVLGPTSGGGVAIKAVQDYVERNRLSNRSKPVFLSAGKAVFKLYLVGVRLGAVNSEFNTQDYALIFKNPE